MIPEGYDMKNYKTITTTPGWLESLRDEGSPNTASRLYAQVPLIYRCIQLRADAISGVPIKLVNASGDDVEWPFAEPLPGLIWKTEASLLLAGAAYWAPQENRYRVIKNIMYLNPFSISVKYEDGKLIFKQGQTEWINDLTDKKYQMVYFSEYDPIQDILPGVSLADVTKTDAQLLSALTRFPRSYFEGGAMPVTLLGIDTTDVGEIQRIESWFKRSVTSVKNAFRVLGFRAGSITPTTLTPPLKDMTMPGLWNDARKNIYTAFGIPESMLDTTAGNYATAKEARLSFYEDVIKPRAQHTYETVINQQLLSRLGLTLQFDFEAMDIFQEDESRRAEVLQALNAANVPLDLALEIAGFELTDEQSARLLPAISSQELAQSSHAEEPLAAELRRYQRMVEKRVKEGKPIRPFESDIIPPALNAAIAGQLEMAKDLVGVRAIFDDAMRWGEYP